VGKRVYGDHAAAPKEKRLRHADARAADRPPGAVGSDSEKKSRRQSSAPTSRRRGRQRGGSLVRASSVIAQRAQRIYDYLATQDLNAIEQPAGATPALG